jgi:DNA (cytosine-5)-methyltransferase 1
MLRALDLFCCAGGATKGLQRAGFYVVGVDINPQPHYCGDSFVQADAMTLDARKVQKSYDLLWASPPCQRYTRAQRLRRNDHPDLIADIRRWLESTGLPWVIENVLDAPLLNPVQLCGTMFGLRTYRHRLFESSFTLVAPNHPKHIAPLRKMGRPVQAGEFMHIVGNFSGVDQAREIMDCSWMVRDELREAIPPAYSEYIAHQFLASL